MKAMIFANTDGNLEMLCDVMHDDQCDASVALCAGNLPLIDKNTPIEKFYKGAETNEGMLAHSSFKDKNGIWKQRTLPKFTYAMYGSTDDLFAAPVSYANVVPVAHYWILDMIAYANKMVQNANIPFSKRVKVGFLGGYYSPDYWGDINESRVSRLREKKSLILCAHDFKEFENKKLDYLITFEAPHKYDKEQQFHGGCEKITKLVRSIKPNIHFHAHLRKFMHGYIGNTLSIGIPALKYGYCILDLYSGQIQYVLSPFFNDGKGKCILKNTKQSI